MSRINDIWLRKPAGLVLGLDFSGERKDSCDGKAGTLTGGATINAGTRYLTTSGSYGQYLSIADSADLSFTNGSGQDLPFSISGWVYPTSSMATLYSDLVVKGSGSTYEYLFRISNASASTLALVYSGGSVGIYRGRLVATSPAAGQWSHMVFTYSGNEAASGCKIYQNAAQVDTTDVIAGAYAGMSNTSEAVKIGPAIPGRTAGVLIYNRALTQPEIAQIYNAGAARIAQGGTP